MRYFSEGTHSFFPTQKETLAPTDFLETNLSISILGPLEEREVPDFQPGSHQMWHSRGLSGRGLLMATVGCRGRWGDTDWLYNREGFSEHMFPENDFNDK